MIALLISNHQLSKYIDPPNTNTEFNVTFDLVYNDNYVNIVSNSIILYICKNNTDFYI